jgi:hypothetical protein
MRLRVGALVAAAEAPEPRGPGGGTTLIGKLDASQMRLITTTGRNRMPTFKDVYDVNQIRDESRFIPSVLPKGTGATK